MDAPALSPLRPEHLPQAVELSRAEGWPHRLEDWALVLGLGRGAVALAADRASRIKEPRHRNAVIRLSRRLPPHELLDSGGWIP